MAENLLRSRLWLGTVKGSNPFAVPMVPASRVTRDQLPENAGPSAARLWGSETPHDALPDFNCTTLVASGGLMI